MLQLPIPPIPYDQILKICRAPHSGVPDIQIKEFLLQYIITEHYFLYIRSKHLFDFKKNVDITFDLYYGKDTLLNIQKTCEYHNACDYFFGGPCSLVTTDQTIISLAKKFVSYFKAVEDSIAETNLQIKNLLVVFYFIDLLEYTFSCK